MNLTVPQSSVLLGKFVNEIKPMHTEVVVCPSFTDIYSAAELLKNSDIEVGAQNIFHEDSGAFTGEVSAYQLKGFANFCIVGHSERRHIFNESDKMVAKKAASCVRHDITPIVCVGENLHERLDGLTNLVVAGQLEASLSDLTGKEIAQSIVAYEPVWAIGTGQVCDPKKANDVAKKIRNLIKVLHGELTAEKVRIVYGGSINDKNAKGFLGESDIDGFLVGGSSLNHVIFAKIVNEVESFANQRAIKDVQVKRKPVLKIPKTQISKKPKSKKRKKSV